MNRTTAPLRIALFGASGSIGSAIAAEALARGHTVIAVARDPSRVNRDALGSAAAAIGAGSAGPVELVEGDVTDPGSVSAAAARSDVLVSAVGGARDGRPDVVEVAARTLLSAAGTTRVFFVGGAGSLAHPAGGTANQQPGFPEAWLPGSLAQGRALDIFRGDDGDVDWTYLSPADRIEPGERTGSYRTGDDALVVAADGRSHISIADYAVAVLDELEAPRFRGRRFTIGY